MRTLVSFAFVGSSHTYSVERLWSSFLLWVSETSLSVSVVVTAVSSVCPVDLLTGPLVTFSSYTSYFRPR